MSFSFKFNHFIVARTTGGAQTRLELRITTLFLFFFISKILAHYIQHKDLKHVPVPLHCACPQSIAHVKGYQFIEAYYSISIIRYWPQTPSELRDGAHKITPTVQRFNSIWYCSETSGSFREADSYDFAGFSHTRSIFFINSKRYCSEKANRDMWLKANKLISLASKYSRREQKPKTQKYIFWSLPVLKSGLFTHLKKMKWTLIWDPNF